MRFLLPLALCVLVGCAGSVSVDGDSVDSFGPGTSAAYVVLDLDGDTSHLFVLANQGGICSKLQTAFAGAYAAADAWSGSLDDDECNAYTAALAEAWGPVTSGAAHFLPLSINNGFEFTVDEATEPSEGTFDAGQSEALLGLSYYPSGDSPYEVIADAAEGCDWGEVWEDAGDSVTSYSATDGDVVLEEGSNDGWRVDFDVEIDDEEGDSAGDLAGGFGAPLCDVELDDLGVFDYALNPAAYSPWLL